MPSLAANPAVLPTHRIQVVDALRGFALFGILLVHCGNSFTTGGMPPDFYEHTRQGMANQIVGNISGILFDGKFFTFFSFLFGLSFALMLTRSTDSAIAFYRRFAWRLLILGVIGFLHHLWWPGDILSIYALLGFPLVALSFLPNRWVLIIGVLLVLNLPNRLYQIYTDATKTEVKLSKKQEETKQKQEQAKQTQEAKAYYDVTTKGTFTQRLDYNLRAFETKMKFQLESGRLFITLGFFLLGLYAGRRKVFQRLAENRRFFRRTTLFTGLATLGVFIPGLILALIYGGNQQPPQWVITVFQSLFDVFNAALTLFYIAGLTVLFQKIRWQSITGPLASVGKMALTNYVLQSIIGGLIFFGYGLNLIVSLQLWQCILLTFPIILLQILFSQWWLARFRFGPLEWLWRSLTYLKVQPMQVQSVKV
jgi:uncharacterized protein